MPVSRLLVLKKVAELELLDADPRFHWNQPTHLLLKPNTAKAALVRATVNGRKACLSSDARGFIHSVSFTAYLKNQNPKRRTMTVQIRARGSWRLLFQTTLQPAAFQGVTYSLPGTGEKHFIALTPDERFAVYVTFGGPSLAVKISPLQYDHSIKEVAVLSDVQAQLPFTDYNTILTTTHYGSEVVNVVAFHNCGAVEVLWNPNSISTTPPPVLQSLKYSTHLGSYPLLSTASLSPKWAAFLLKTYTAGNRGNPQLLLFPRKDWTTPAMRFQCPGMLTFDGGPMLAASDSVFLFGMQRWVVEVDAASRTLVRQTTNRRQVRWCDRLYDLPSKTITHSGGVWYFCESDILLGLPCLWNGRHGNQHIKN